MKHQTLSRGTLFSLQRHTSNQLVEKRGDDISQTKPLLVIDRPHFTVKLYENLLKVDLKGSLKNEIEEAIENKPILKETFGSLLSIFVPLHVHLNDIRWIHVEEAGKVKLTLHHRRDIVIPLERKDGETLASKLNGLIALARRRNLEITRIKNREKHRIHSKRVRPSSYVTMPWYFPTEQVDIVNKFQRRTKKRKKSDSSRA